MSKETAFYPRLKALTDQWMDLFGYWAPSVVTDTLEEYRSVRETAGLMDFCMLRKYDIEGREALEGINRLVTRDVATLQPGHIAYGALCNEDGKMVDDCTVMVRSADRLRFCGANDKDFEYLRRAVASSGATVRDVTDETGHLCLQGPESREWLQGLADRDLSGDVFPYYTFKDEVVIAGIPVFMTRLGYTAELGYELWVDRSRSLELWDRLLEALEPKGMKVIGMTALDLLRIEGGFIIGGIEYNETVSPYECGLGWAVKLEKGEFQGRTALEHDKQASNVRLTSVVLESGEDAASGAPVFVNGTEVGLVTQAVSSPYLNGKTLGLAKLRKDLAVPGTQVVAELGGKKVSGEVVRHPAYEPDRRKVRS
jgi:glycine cleavage system T protein (aminomethyltransferase)